MNYNCHNAAVSEFILLLVFEVTFVCANTTTEFCYDTVRSTHLRYALLEFSPRLNQPLPQFYHMPEWYTVHRLLYHSR